MVNKKVISILIVALCVSLVGCGDLSTLIIGNEETTTEYEETTIENEETISKNDVSNDDFIEVIGYTYIEKYGPYIAEIKDKETGGHYFIYKDEEAGAGTGVGIGMCPRYNSDGTLYSD